MSNDTINRNLVYMKKSIVALAFLLISLPGLRAQSTHALSLEDAVKLGLDNSKQLKQSKNKIDEAITKLNQAKDAQLPSAKVGFQYLNAFMLTQTWNSGFTQNPLQFPFYLPAYIGTASVSEPIFAGNSLRYAKKSADLMIQMSKLDAEKDKDDVIYLVIESYVNINKIIQSQKVVAQNMEDVDGKLTEIIKYEAQGLATKNDVLRYQLQKSQIQLNQIELENNRKIAVYNLDIVLGLPDTTDLDLTDAPYKLSETPVFSDLISQADSGRKEILDYGYQDKVADINIKTIQGQRLPTLAATGGAYYINPTKRLIPEDNTALVPLTLGLALNWDLGSLWTNRNKVRQAEVQKRELQTDKDIALDDIHKEVHRTFIEYQQALQQIKVLEVAVEQAEENERVTEAKFKNNLVSTTDRIDAQTLLYQSRVNLELAKSDATIAYYTMLKSTGTIHL